ncbi:MAG: hypothetical protein GF334_13445 [Candidatus Altiarchaeales archaeon]|nr:hypothetical protein [Candidatus Altiarchaeales archaeon]
MHGPLALEAVPGLSTKDLPKPMATTTEETSVAEIGLWYGRLESHVVTCRPSVSRVY